MAHRECLIDDAFSSKEVLLKGLGGILADEQGLGKTATILAHIQRSKNVSSNESTSCADSIIKGFQQIIASFVRFHALT